MTQSKPTSRKTVQSVFPKPIYLGAATRTPIGKFGGTLARLSASDLATHTLKECRTRAVGVENVDLVIMGHARQAGCGPNVARQATIFSGLPDTVPAITVNQACASGMIALFTALEKIALGRATSIFAGGVESMSNTPYLLPRVRWGQRLGHGEVLDGMWKDGFYCPMSQMVMGETVERFLVPEFKVTRKEQDEYALQSQQRAETAWSTGLFTPETFEIPGDAKNPPLREDEHRRGNTTFESLQKLPAVFDRNNGTVTAGNSSGITDGSAFLHVTDQKMSHAQVEVLDYESVALDPRRMGLGPVPATLNILKRNGLTVSDLESVELNEAFAAQVIACQRELKIPNEKLNPRGGSIALGHPIGATGARITVTLINQLKDKPGALGVATLCVSGGHGAAILLRGVC